MRRGQSGLVRRTIEIVLSMGILLSALPANASTGKAGQVRAQVSGVAWAQRDVKAQSGPTGEIALADGEGLWLFDLSTGEKRLIKKDVGIKDVTWSPDGQWLAYTAVAEDDIEETDVYIVKVDGSGFKKVSSDWARLPSWRPDGVAVAYLRYVPLSSPAIEEIPVNGGAPNNLWAVNEGEKVSGLAYSPDGKDIVFSSDREAQAGTGASEGDLYDLTVGSRAIRSLVSAATLRVTFPTIDFSGHLEWRRGTQISYPAESGGDLCIGLADSDGSNSHCLWLRPSTPSAPDCPGTYSWSPDGHFVAVSVTDCTGGASAPAGWSIYKEDGTIYKGDGDMLTRVTQYSEEATALAWRPTTIPVSPVPASTPSSTVTPMLPTATPTSTSSKPAIVLVHGINNVGVECKSVDPEKYFEDVVPLLTDTYKIFYAHLDSTPCGTPPIADNVKYLEDTVHAAFEYGQQPVTIIAHSMGGLVARAYIEAGTPCKRDAGGRWVSGYCDDVKELFTFGTLHTGVNMSSELWAALFSGDCLTDASFISKQAVLEDFKEDVRVKWNAQPQHQRNGKVTYHLIGGDLPPDQRSPLGATTDLVLFGDVANDGIVPLESSIGLPGKMDRLSVPQAHNGLFGGKDYFKEGTESYNCIKQVLVDKTSTMCGEVTTREAKPLPPLKPKKVAANELARSIADLNQWAKRTAVGGVCVAALFTAGATWLGLTASEVAATAAEYVIRTGEYVGGVLIRWAIKVGMSAKDFVAMVGEYAAKRGKEVVGEAARIIGEWAEQAKLNASDIYAMTKDAINHNLPFYDPSVHSPATILVTNQQGQRAGVLEDGTVIEDIPGSKVVVINSDKYVFVPPGNIASTEVTGTGTGTMTVEVAESDGNGNGRITSYKDVAVTPQLRAHIDTTGSQPALVLNAGDGGAAQSRLPDKVENISAGQSTIENPRSQQVDNSNQLFIGAGVLAAAILAGAILLVATRRKRIRAR